MLEIKDAQNALWFMNRKFNGSVSLSESCTTFI